MARYSKHFKRQAVELVLESQCPATTIADLLDMPVKTLQRWVREARGHVPEPQRPALTPVQMQRLRDQCGVRRTCACAGGRALRVA